MYMADQYGSLLVKPLICIHVADIQSVPYVDVF